MTELLRISARWSGFSGAPGYTVMHFRDFGSGDGGGGPVIASTATAAAARVRTFFDGVKGFLPAAVQVQIEADAEVIEDTTGSLVNSFSTGTNAPVQGTGTGFYSAPTGAVVNWRTSGIRNGRRLRGKTFLVPLATGAFSATGTLSAGTRTALSTAAATLADSTSTPDLFVYGRPTAAGAADGVAFAVTSFSVPEIAAVLRSRRD